jgi:hypothetical protein
MVHKLGAYLPRVSALASRWVERLGLGGLPVAIPAGQITVIAEKL